MWCTAQALRGMHLDGDRVIPSLYRNYTEMNETVCPTSTTGMLVRSSTQLARIGEGHLVGHEVQFRVQASVFDLAEALTSHYDHNEIRDS